MADPTQDFISTYGPLANDIAGQTGLDPAVVLGHMAHESNWGQSIGGNNPFGLTDGHGNKSQYLDIPGAAQAYVNLFNSPRYAGVGKLTDPSQQIAALTNSGYGPGPADAAAHPDQASGQAYANAIAMNVAKVRSAGFGAPPPPQQQPSTLTPEQMEAQTAPSAQTSAVLTPEQMEAQTRPPAAATTPPPPPPSLPVSPGAEPDDASIQSQVGGPGITPVVPTSGPATLAPITAAGKAILNSAVSGYQNTPNLLSPGAQSYLETQTGPLGSQIVGPAVHLVNAGLGVMGGIGQAVTQEIPYQIGNALSGPSLGRDLAGLTTAGMMAAGADSAVRPVGQPAFDQTAADRAAVPLSRDFTGNPFTSSAEAKAPLDVPTAPVGESAPTPAPPASTTPAYFTGAGESGGGYTATGESSINKRAYYKASPDDVPTPAANTPDSPVPNGQSTVADSHVIPADTASGTPAMITTKTPDGSVMVATKEPSGYVVRGGQDMTPTNTVPHLTAAIEQAASEGVPLHSDSSVGAGDINAWRFLREQGYPVTENPLIWSEDEAGENVVAAKTKDGSPAFSVDPTQMPGPQPVGAAVTPAADAAVGRRMFEAARLTNEQNTLAETPADRANGQGWDTTQYVPGSVPTKAEYTGDPQIALQQRSDFENPDQVGRWTAIDDSNDAARRAFFQKEAGSPTTLLNKQNQIASDFAPRYTNLWKTQTEVPETRVGDAVSQIKGVLDGPDGKNTAVENALNGVSEKLYKGNDPDNGLETSPQQLFGARQEVARLMGSVAKRANPALGDPKVAFHLGQLKDTLDGIIEDGAPGYQKTQHDYSEAMKAVDKQRLLQSYAPELTDVRGHMTLNKVQNMMEDIVEQRGSPGANQAKSLSDDDMGALWDLRNDLARRSNIDLGKARGSPTVQNSVVLNALTKHLFDIGSLPVHFAMNRYLGDATGNLLLGGYQAVRYATQQQRAALAAVNERRARVNGYLTPPDGFGPPPPPDTSASNGNQSDQSTRYAANAPPTPQPGSRPEQPMIPQPILPYQTPWYLRTAANDLSGHVGGYLSSDQPPDNDQIDRAPPIEDRLDPNTVRDPSRLRGVKGLNWLTSRIT